MRGGGQSAVCVAEYLVGSEGVNVLQLLCDLLDLVQKMNFQLANHTHGGSPVSTNSAGLPLMPLKQISC